MELIVAVAAGAGGAACGLAAGRWLLNSILALTFSSAVTEAERSALRR
jgi:hypothetical protein